jgi:hypothetical protein
MDRRASVMEGHLDRRDVADLDSGMAVRAILQRRVDDARVNRDQAVADLREVMTDAECLEEFGIDLREV